MRWQKEDGRCKQNKETTALSSAKGVFPLDMELLSRETLATRTISIQFLEEKKNPVLSHYFLHINFVLFLIEIKFNI